MSYFTGCGCLPKQSIVIYSSTNFARLQAGPVDFAGTPLVLRRSDKRRVVTDINIYSTLWTLDQSSLACDSHVIRAVLTHATIEEIEAEKSLIEDQAVCTVYSVLGRHFCLVWFCTSHFN